MQVQYKRGIIMVSNGNADNGPSNLREKPFQNNMAESRERKSIPT